MIVSLLIWFGLFIYGFFLLVKNLVEALILKEPVPAMRWIVTVLCLVTGAVVAVIPVLLSRG